jgi:dTDP-4-amino-4,6-dideoxygalactose transaminase
LPVVRPWRHDHFHSSFHLYIVRLMTAAIKPSHRQVFESLRSRGIGVNLHYIPIHTQPYYRARGFRRGQYAEAERYYSEAISLPLFPTLDERQVERIAGALKDELS